MSSVIKSPSAWVPILMSLAALAMVIGYATVFGVARHADEGTPARLFQLLMAAQVPIIGYFAIRWLPQMPKAAVAVIALQALAALAPVALIAALER